MTMEEARSFIERLADSPEMTADMKEELQRLKDSADESIGMEDYWKRMDEKLDAVREDFKDFRRNYVERITTREDAERSHRRDSNRDGREEFHREEDNPIEKIFTEEVIEK